MINSAKSYTYHEYLEILRRRIWYIIIPFVLVTVGAFIYAMTAPRQYKASTLVLISQQKAPVAFSQATEDRIEESRQSMVQQIMSRTYLEKIIADLRLYENAGERISKEKMIKTLRENIEIEFPRSERGDESDYYSISFTGKDPSNVAAVANRLSSLFIEETLNLKEKQTRETTEFMANELAAAKAKLDEMETKLSTRNRRTTRLIQPSRTRFTERDNLKRELVEALRTRYAERDNVKRELEALRSKYTENHPDVIAMKKKLANIENDTDNHPDVIALKQKIADLGKNTDHGNNYIQVTRPQAYIEQTPSIGQENGAPEGEYRSLREAYENLLKKSQEVQQAENLQKRINRERFRIIDPAMVPERPFSPNRRKIFLMGLFAGLAIGLSLAFVREQLDRSFYDSDDVEISLGIKVLATIPKIEEQAS